MVTQRTVEDLIVTIETYTGYGSIVVSRGKLGNAHCPKNGIVPSGGTEQVRPTTDVWVLEVYPPDGSVHVSYGSTLRGACIAALNVVQVYHRPSTAGACT